MGTAYAQPVVQQRPIMVVFIHGTLIPFPSFGLLYHAMRYAIKYNMFMDHAFARALRFHTINRQQPMSAEGLWPLRQAPHFDTRMTQANCLFADLFEQVWHTSGSLREKAHLHPYIFGWNGKLSHKQRCRAASELHHNLVVERDLLAGTYNCRSDEVKLVVVGYSHGGNLGLMLAQQLDPLPIDRLVLMGTPIQEETATCACSQVFKSVLNLYSRHDLGQIADCVSSRGMSGRRLTCRHGCGHIKQVELTVAEQGNARTLLPMHEQLWLFDANNIQLNGLLAPLPTNPFPLSVFIPALLALTEKNEYTNFTARITAQLRGGYAVTLVPHKHKGPERTLLLGQILFSPARAGLRFT